MLTLCLRFRSFPFPSTFFRPLLFRFWLLGLCFFLSSFFPFPPHSGSSSVLPFRFRFFGFPRSFRPDFSCLLSRFFVLGLLFVSFRPSLIRSHSRSSSAYLVLSLSVFSLSFHFLSSASVPVLATWPLFLPFLFLPALASQWLLRCCLSVFRLPCPSTSVPPGFPCFPSISSYSAFCLFPFILPSFAPTAVPLVLPLCSRFRVFPFPSAFFRPLPFGSDYLAFRSFFSLLPVLPCRRFLRCYLSAF